MLKRKCGFTENQKVEYPLPVQVHQKKDCFFSNAVWIDEKNSFLVETIKAVIVTKTHFHDLSCNDFYTLILKKPKLLQEIRSSRKCGTLPKRRNQLLQHQMEINCKRNSVSVNENL
jgi:hypothetical protein